MAAVPLPPGSNPTDAHQQRLRCFRDALNSLYGPFDAITLEAVTSWEPPPIPMTSSGRFLLTDCLGVLNFITISRESGAHFYLVLAEHLVRTLHDRLGRTRDGAHRLPGSTDEQPLSGGLRVGELDEAYDGQSYMITAVWAFALNRLALATRNPLYNDQAIELMRGAQGRFALRSDTAEERLFWRLTLDGCPLYDKTKERIDALCGYVVFRAAQSTARSLAQSPADDTGAAVNLAPEIAQCERIMTLSSIMNRVRPASFMYADPLYVAMSLWACGLDVESTFSRESMMQTVETARNYLGIPNQPTTPWIFSTIAGLRCWGVDDFWEDWLVQQGWDSISQVTDDHLKPFTAMIYACALIPGSLRANYVG